MGRLVTIDHARLLSLVQYDPATGVFTAKTSRGSRKAGTILGTVNGRGYLVAMIDRRIHLLHRTAWFYVHGQWPENEIDHRDRVKTRNAISNLREATRSQNEVNKPARSQYGRGVSWQPHAQKFKACIRIAGKATHIGYAETPEAAAALYRARAVEHYGDFAS